MKKNRTFQILSACFLVLASLTSRADTFFTDNFSNGSTVDGTSAPGGTPTASFTSYDFGSSKTAEPTIGDALLSGKLSSGTSSGYWEAQALFATNPVALTAPGDYIDMQIVFTNPAGVLITGTKSAIWVGLYNSASAPGAPNPPVAGALASAGLNTTAGSVYATGNCQLWAGYAANIRGQGSPIITRPVQDGSATTSANQELLGNGVSGGTFKNPGGTALATSPAQTFALDSTSPYTVQLRITLDPGGSGSLIVSNALYSGVGTGGDIIMSNVTVTATPIASAFDGLAFGAFNSGSSANPQMDVSSISITGQSTVISTPPSITSQPVSVTVPNGGSCAFNVAASGFSMTYQWHRNGTNLVDGGNISGSTSPMLVISPASSADVAADYYVTVTGAGNYSTNSDSVSLALGTAKSLTWNGPGANWDLNTSANWLDANNNPSEFNYGDAVTFNGGGPGQVTLSGSYLSASSVTVNGSYTFSGSGSFAGPGTMSFSDGFFDVQNANTFSGGTTISGASADLYLENYNGLGVGPVTMAGGLLEIVPVGSGSSGIPGDIVVADDSTIAYNAVSSSYSTVFFGNLSGTTGKTLTIQIDALNGASPGAGLDRIRLDGNNTVYDGNLNLASGTTLWAAYGNSQTYNGVISGVGAFMQKGDDSYLNDANTYSGGTYLSSGSIGLGVDSTGSPVTAGPLGVGPLLLAVDSTTSKTGSGQIFASGGARTVANPIQYPTGTNNLTLTVGGTNDLILSGAFTLNGNDGVTDGSITSRTIQVANAGLTTISGIISDNGLSYGFNKTGDGVLALSAAETYTGPTTIGGGTLLVNGSLASSSVTVTSGVLGGSGTISGAVTVQSGGALAPGNQGIGTLTINNTLSFQTGSTNSVEVSKTAGQSDSVTGLTSVSYAGTLLATNLAGTLSVGDSFTIFTAAAHSGDFDAIAGSPGAGLAWSFDPTNGVLSVITGVSMNPTNITFSVSSGNLVLSWPTDHIGWELQTQTNSLATGLSTNWTTVSGSTSVDQMTLPIDPANGAVFFRLVYP